MEQLLRQSAEIMREPKVKMPNTTHGVTVRPAKTPPSKYLLSHLAVRLIVIINIAHLSLTFYRPYFLAKKQVFRGADLDWLMISSLLLPLFCAIETFWMRRAEPSQKKALLIDWAFAITWLLVWLTFLFASFWKYAGSI
jgi:hypothetical protein